MKAQKRVKKMCKIVKLDDAVKNLPEKVKSKLEHSKELNGLYVKNAVVIPFHDMAKETLYYRVSPANSGLVFAEPERARYIARVHHALGSKTWGEFKMKLPSEECDRIISMMFDGEEERWPHYSAPFSSDDVPGHCDGDYPDWLQAEMDSCVPDEILEQYAEHVGTMLNGPYYDIDVTHEEDICRDLRARGFNVIKREDLYFY
jgi:hypothetical protein